MIDAKILDYNQSQQGEELRICERISQIISTHLPQAESKVWHAHPVWFLDANPTVGYVKLKAGIRLMFWSGASFEEEKLQPGTGKFKDAHVMYSSVEQIDEAEIVRWIEKSQVIQWDYKNIVKRKGQLERLS